MNNIQINIYTPNTDFKKILLNLDDSAIKINEREIELTKSEFVVVLNKILNIIKEWENTNLIKLNHYQKIIVQMNLSTDKKEYIFENEVPDNLYEIYDLIENIKEKIK